VLGQLLGGQRQERQARSDPQARDTPGSESQIEHDRQAQGEQEVRQIVPERLFVNAPRPRGKLSLIGQKDQSGQRSDVGEREQSKGESGHLSRTYLARPDPVRSHGVLPRAGTTCDSWLES
tara:strand:- start:4586 stop:4948 length:363 start_codon:yes stop_codon:yes gene_type:complete